VAPGVYYVRLVAFNAGGTSPASNEAVLTVVAPSAPVAPTLNAPSVSSNTVSFSWTLARGAARRRRACSLRR